ncbi:12890_t:CDS:2 [Entrophospora sp. SA101]|nr:4631_t:CDS:2 [Entrophospora sp. SA101]CAJ0647254.1 12890_t:CDS:2 [Entrophospora sp. SA101]
MSEKISVNYYINNHNVNNGNIKCEDDITINNSGGSEGDCNNNYNNTKFSNNDGEGSEDVEVEKAEPEDSVRTPLQNKFHYFFEEPRSTLAIAFSILSVASVIATVVAICVQSYTTIPAFDPRWWLPIDLAIALVFTLEYFGRLYASLNKFKFLYRPSNVVDFLSVLPFYLQFINILGSRAESLLRVFRIIRLLKILRIIHVTRVSIGIGITAKVFKKSMHQILMVSLYLLIALLVSSTIMYDFEHGELLEPTTLTWYRYNGNDTEISPFQSIIGTFWWSIATLTTTGYGDAVPITASGRIIAGATMICGILVIALLTSIIGSNFVSEWENHKRAKLKQRPIADILKGAEISKKKKIRMLQKQNGIMLETITEIQDKLLDLNPSYPKLKKDSDQNKNSNEVKLEIHL